MTSHKYQLHFNKQKQEVYFLDSKGWDVPATAFFSEHFEEVVYFPTLEHLTAIIANACPKQEYTNLPVLSSELFYELDELFDIKDMTSNAMYDFTSHWFAKWYAKKTAGSMYSLTYEGCELLYYHLTDCGAYDLEGAAQNIYDIANSYQDCDPEHILYLLDSEYDMKEPLSDSEVMSRAVELLSKEGYFYDTFEKEDKPMILTSVF